MDPDYVFTRLVTFVLGNEKVASIIQARNRIERKRPVLAGRNPGLLDSLWDKDALWADLYRRAYASGSPCFLTVPEGHQNDPRIDERNWEILREYEASPPIAYAHAIRGILASLRAHMILHPDARLQYLHDALECAKLADKCEVRRCPSYWMSCDNKISEFTGYGYMAARLREFEGPLSWEPSLVSIDERFPSICDIY